MTSPPLPPPPTVRLYHTDSWLLSFEARVLAHGTFAGRPSLLLDRTAFYPESGGQLADHGVIERCRVVDVQVDDDGRVHHLLDANAVLPPAGSEIEGEIDRARRRIHMAQHTGQHMLSKALLDVAGAATVSARLGESACTIDLDRDPISDRQLRDAEDLVNAVIDDDAVVRAFFPDEDQLAILPLRRVPKVEHDIRVIAIGDFDVSPCGGTHCTRTAQVGMVRISGAERYKGMTRITFAAGRRARAELAEHSSLLRRMAAELTCGPGEVPGAVDKLRRDLGALRLSLRALRDRLAEVAVPALLATGEPHVVASFPGGDAELLRALASQLTADGDRVAFLAAPTDDGIQVLVARGPSSQFDCGAFLHAVTRATGGRGGGRPDRAEGRLPAGSDWTALAATARPG